MSDPYVPNEGKLENLNDVNAQGAPFTCHLCLAPNSVGPTTTASGMTEASYAGYAAQGFSYGAAALDGSGRPALTGTAQLTFTSTGTSTPGTQSVIGWYVTSTTGKLSGGVKYFPNVIDFSVNGATVAFTPYLPSGDICAA